MSSVFFKGLKSHCSLTKIRKQYKIILMNKTLQTTVAVVVLLAGSLLILSIAYNFYKGGFCKDSEPIVTPPIPAVTASPSATLEPTKTATPTVSLRRFLPTATPTVTTTP